MGVQVFLCENGPDGRAALFEDAVETVTARTPDEVGPALARLDAARASGGWIAGYISYEAGAAFERRIAPRDAPLPLLCFGIHDAPRPAPDWQGEGAVADLRPLVPREDYMAAFGRVKDYIAAGDVYQVNLTFPMEGRLDGTPRGLYAQLRAAQPVGHGAYAEMAEGPVILSRSPELFFAVGADGAITARPMKGTAPRDADAARDAALAAELVASEKVRAENLMIVDLLRNDIARIAKTGSVRVPQLFHVESYATVHQMTSTVTGMLEAAPSMARLMPALFPCGSVTGAPKIRAMQIIAELEPFPRGVYCGAMGWMAPSGAAAFNVAIRTLTIYGQRVVMNVGGGVVHDSTGEGEWEEALWKARFAQNLASA